MVSEMAEIMEYCEEKARLMLKLRKQESEWAYKNELAARQSVYENIAKMAREALINGGYLEDNE